VVGWRDERRFARHLWVGKRERRAVEQSDEVISQLLVGRQKLLVSWSRFIDIEVKLSILQS